MPSIKDEAIVLRRLDYSETSQVLAFLTRTHGPQRLIAKGIKRGTKQKFATGIDLLERGDLVFIPSQRGSLGTLTEWRQKEPYLGLRNELQRLYIGQYATEVTAGMMEESDPHPEVFDGLAVLLKRVSNDDEPMVCLVAYQMTLLRAAGLQPDLNRCVFCDKPAPPDRAGYLAPHEGGLICRDCEPGVAEKRKVGAATLTALREDKCTPQTAPTAFDLLNYIISHAMGKAPTLAKFILPK